MRGVRTSSTEEGATVCSKGSCEQNLDKWVLSEKRRHSWQGKSLSKGVEEGTDLTLAFFFVPPLPWGICLLASEDQSSRPIGQV